MKTPTPQAQSDTPRTDAEAFSLGIGDCTVVDSDFARTLGRGRPGMTKREAILTQRLAAAHRFIYGQMKHAENYGSSFSEGVFVDCERFLKDNKPKQADSVVVIPLWRYKRLMNSRLAALKAKHP